MNRQFYVRAYRGDAGAWYGPDGQKVAINCNHTVVGDYGMNAEGQIVELPPADVVTAGGKSVLVSHATPFPDTTQPGLSLIAVKLIKDKDLQTAWYVDAIDYASSVVACNPVAYVTSCPGVSNLIATPDETEAVITWDETPGIVGVEYSNSTVDVEPESGTFLGGGTGEVTITGLTTATSYYFFIRTICAGAVTSDWSRVEYETL